MAYARFSTPMDDGSMNDSDVYVYKSTLGGFTIHTAVFRIDKTEPMPPFPRPDENGNMAPNAGEEYDKLYDAWRERNSSPLMDEVAGKTTNTKTHQETLDELIALQKLGVRVPASCIARLKKEMSQ